MAYHNETGRRSTVASTDLDACLFRAVDLVAANKIDIAGAGAGFGILANKPKAGEDASVIVEGESEVRVGVAVTAGQYGTSAASGWLVPLVSSFQVASGAVITTKTAMGRFKTAAASGMLATMEVNPFLVAVNSI